MQVQTCPTAKVRYGLGYVLTIHLKAGGDTDETDASVRALVSSHVPEASLMDRTDIVVEPVPSHLSSHAVALLSLAQLDCPPR